jgi:hypothetical protein
MSPRILAFVLLGLAPLAARAGSRTQTLTGGALSIDTPCAVQVDIRPDAALHGQVTVAATADRQEELDQLAFDSGSRAGIHAVDDRCWQPGPFGHVERTLRLAVSVPPGMALSIDESGAGRYTLGEIGGPLKLDISGAAKLRAGAVTTFDLDLSGAGSVQVTRVSGAAHVDISGHGDVAVDRGEMPELAGEISGAGSLAIAAGTIGHVRLEDSGVGSIRIGAAVGDASVDLSGLGSVHLARVTGKLEKEVSGMGSITVGD